MNLFDDQQLIQEWAVLESKSGRRKARIRLNSFVPTFRWLARSKSVVLKKVRIALDSDDVSFMTPAGMKRATIDGKERMLFEFSPIEALLHRAFSSWLDDRISPQYSENLHSYQKGRSWWTASRSILKYLKDHRRNKKVQQRGLYVIRRDVEAYTDTIPLNERSQLWSLLQRRASMSAFEMKWAKRILRPDIRNQEGGLQCNLRGVPTGSPISCVIFNACLMDLDEAMSKIPGGFYARYSDDLIFAHEDPTVAIQADQILMEHLSRFELRYKAEKAQNLYWTGAAHSTEKGSQWKGVSEVEFLGMSFHFSGRIGLRKKRLNRLRENLKARILNASRHAGVAGELCARRICQSVNWALDPDDPSFSAGYSVFLRTVVTNRGQLKELDDWIYRTILRVAFGRDSPSVVRKYPPARLREWGLPGLVHDRNQYRRNGVKK
jgi:hypothetical protein